MTVHSRIRSKFKRLNWRFAPVLIAVIAVLSVSYFSGGQSGYLSPEVKFTDLSKSGLQIVPASCPSTPDFTGQCNGSPPPPNDCDLTASSYNVGSGQSVTLSWIVNNTLPIVSGTISPAPGNVGTASSGSVTVNPTATTDYVYAFTYPPTAAIAGGQCDATVTVVPMPACTVTFGQNPIAYGSGTSLTWSSANATTMYINNIGYVSASGSTTVAPLATTDYSCTAGSGALTGTYSAILTVTSPAAPPTATIAASSTSIQVGQSTNLTATFTPGAVSAPTVIYLTSGTSWQVPNDWNSAHNTIEVIGGGGGGAVGSDTNGPGGGGGGGGYSEISDLALTPGASVPYTVGSGGTQGSSGSGTWFDGGSCLSSAVCARAGAGASGTNGGAGAAASSDVGTIKYSGGNGGSQNNGGGGMGGGGAGGPKGAGGNGSTNGPVWGGAGGGGNGGGSAGNAPASTNGGTGGNNFSGSGGAAGGTVNVSGSAGTNGGGGGGGGAGSGAAGGNGGAGGPGVDWDATHGSGGGGGGGGGGSSGQASGAGGAGALYGGGGGGGGINSSLNTAGTGGSGAQGIVVITYYSTSPDPITASNIDQPLGTGLAANTNPGPKSIKFTPTAPGTYTFYAMATTNYYSTWTSYAQTTVTVSATPSCNVSLAPSTISSGQSSTLSYSSADATSFSINNVGSVTPNISGSTTVSPTQTTDYTGTIHYNTYGATKTIYITSGTTWTVPSDWDNTSNTVEVIGGGGGGNGESSGFLPGGGGGGGAYAERSNLSLTPGGTVQVQIGVGGAAGPGSGAGNGGDTWFNGTSVTSSSVGTKGGTGGGINASGAGGSAGASNGAITYSGGAGGTNGNGGGGLGGGGAAGPHGAGGQGGANYTGTYGAGGGGGNGGGSAGGPVVSNNGSNGGNNNGNSGGGVGGIGTDVNGTAGSNGGGGGGGSTDTGTGGFGGNGGTGTEWDASHGSGGGGGGGGSPGGSGTAYSSLGGKGGLYGGGGGGAGGYSSPYQQNNTTYAPGAQGIIVVTYTPVTSSATTLTCPATLTLSCTPAYSCSGSTIQYTNASCQTSNVTTCVAPAFCSAGSSSCLTPAITGGALQVSPSIVHSGATTKVSWNANNAQSCTVTGTNGDGTVSSTDPNSPGVWTGLSSPAGGETSSPIGGVTTYTLLCIAYGTNPNFTQSATVTLTPLYQER